MFAPNLLAQADPEVWNAVRLENQRQEDHVELIASENYVSPAVLLAQGSQLTNKYAEGYPGKRYYGGCEYVDMAESIAIERAKKLFGAPWANVQPHSGSQANQAVYTAALKPGDTMLGMSLAHGGHLTHGSPVNLSGKLYRIVSYGLNERKRSTTTRPRKSPGREAEAHRHRRIGLFARHRLEALPRHRRQVRRAADGRHRALRRPDRGRPLSLADRHRATSSPPPRTRRCAARAAAWCSAWSEFEKAIDERHLPRAAGRAADARDRRQGGGVRRGAEAGVQDLPEAGARERAAPWRAVLHAARPAHRLGAHRPPHVPARPARREDSPARTPRRRSGARTSR